MTWLKKNLIFTILMLLLLGALGYETYITLGDRKKATAAENTFESKIEEHQRLSRKDILPHQTNVNLTKEEIDRRVAEMEIYEQALGHSAELEARFADYPNSSANALFVIQFFGNEYRQTTARATEMDNDALANELFGFQAYSQSGPEASLIPTVQKPRLIVAYILDCLLEANPEALVSVARPGEAASDTSAPDPSRGQSQAGSAGFSLDSKLSTAIPDVAQTSPYQVVFTGRTSTLRTFINELASFDMPLIVRSVVAEPASGTGSSTSSAGTDRRRRRATQESTSDSAEQEQEADENIPLVADNLSRFTVAMEFVDIVPHGSAR